MKIESGKYYKTHKGQKAYVVFEISAPYHGNSGKFVGEVFNKKDWVMCRFDDSGKCSAGPECDIVSEWIEKPEWCRGNPAWARWQAHDEDGECFWYELKPSLKRENWDEGEGNLGEIPMSHTPLLPPGCHWQDSLVEAPEGWGKDAK